MQKKQEESTALVWFRNNLRIEDNPPLTDATKNHSKVIAVYSFDQKQFGKTEWGFPKTGAYRFKFLLESLMDLKDNLKDLNIPLLIVKGDTSSRLKKIVEDYNISDIYTPKEVTWEEIKVEQEIDNKLPDVILHYYHLKTLYHPEDIPFNIDDIPKVFTNFRKKTEKQSEVRSLYSFPETVNDNDYQEKFELPDYKEFGIEEPIIDKRTAFPFRGGEAAGNKRIDEYFWETNKLGVYKKTRNGLIGTDYSSKLSAWLANGSLSPRIIYNQVKKYENERRKNQSTYWLIFELIWRDFFNFVSMRHGNDIFKFKGINGNTYKVNNNERLFEKWKTGNTGDDFVDANMKELMLTGFMSNRGRQNVASYLVNNMSQDWRKGASWFESQLIDYDVTSNWGNWMYNSGVGNDPRNRKFNTQSQADRYDKNGKYRRMWLEEGMF